MGLNAAGPPRWVSNWRFVIYFGGAADAFAAKHRQAR
jgi:hypothetical protein